MVIALVASRLASLLVVVFPVQDAPAPVREEVRDVASDVPVIAGRFLLPDGSPAPGVRLDVHAWQANSERVAAYGKSVRWENVSGTSGPDGRFALRFFAPPPYQFTLDARLAGYVMASWRWSELENGKTLDVGDVKLATGGTLIVRLVMPDGSLIRDGWSLSVQETRPFSFDGIENVRLCCSAPNDAGEWVFPDAPAGRLSLLAEATRQSGRGGSETVEVRAGETTRFDWPYGPAPDRPEDHGILVSTFVRPMHPLEPDAAHVKLTDATGRSRTAESRGMTWFFPEVDAGPWTLIIDDPRFDTFQRGGLEAGWRVSAQLHGNAGVRLDVRDATTGAAIERYAMAVECVGVNFSPSRFSFQLVDAAPPADGVHRGIVAGDFDLALVIDSPGYAQCFVPLGRLQPGEIRTVTAEMIRGTSVTGHVFSADGRPAPNIDVRLLREGVEHPSGIDLAAPRWRSTESDADGAFRFDAVVPGNYFVFAIVDPEFLAKSARLAIDEVSAPPPLRLDLPAAHALSGRVDAPTGVSLDGFSISAQMDRDDWSLDCPFPDLTWNWRQAGTKVAALTADGSFRLEAVPRGRVGILLLAPVDEPGDASTKSRARAVAGLGTLDVGDDPETRVALDASASFPARVTVLVQIAGADPDSFEVGLVLSGSRFSPVARGRANDGVVRLGFVPVGRYSVVLNRDHHFAHDSGVAIDVAPNHDVDVTVTLEFSSASVRVVDAVTGEPLVRQWVRVGQDDREDTGDALRTDDGGRLILSLLAGRYVLARSLGFAPEVAEFVKPLVDSADRLPAHIFRYAVPAEMEWTAAGPQPAEVRLSDVEKN